MATANIQAARPVKTASSNSTSSAAAKRFHGRLKIDATFCPADVADPFDTVEWEVRTAADQGRERRRCCSSRPTARSRRSGASWPPTSSSASTSTARSARPSASTASGSSSTASPARSPTGASRTATSPRAEDGERFYRELDLALPAPARRVQLARLVQRRPVPPVRRQRRQVQLALGRRDARRRAAREPLRISRKARPASSRASTTTWKTSWSSPAARPCCSSSARGTGTDLSTLRSHREKLSGGGKPSRPAVVHAGLRPDRRGREERRQDPPRRQDAVASRSGTPTSWNSSSASRRKRRRPACLIEKGGYEANFNGEAYSSIMFQNANLSVRVTDEFMQAVEKDEDWTTHWVTDAQPRRPDVPGPRRARPHGRMRLALRRPRRAVRHDDQPLAHLPQQRPHQRQQSVQRVHVPRRHGLQPGQHQPDEVPPAGRHVRRRAVQGRLPHLLHRPGNPGRSRQLSDASDIAAQQPPVPPAGPGLLEPRQPAHGRRACRTTATPAAASAAR